MVRKLLVAIALVFIPTVSRGIQLHWASGSTNVSFTSATRCTLVVEADSGEVALPAEWHLLWTAQRCGRLSVVLDTASTDSSVAHVTDFGPESLAEAATNGGTAGFQSDTPGFIRSAQYLLDLPAGSSGKFQVVASLVSDELQRRTLIRSQVVTFNGGVNVALPPALVHASSEHSTAHLTVDAQGVGLGTVTAVAIVAPDTSWRIPLEIAEATDSTLSAFAEVLDEIPRAVLQVTFGSGSGSSASLAVATCRNPTTTATTQYNSVLFADPNSHVSTKDFAFHFNHHLPASTGPALFHLMYIRHLDPSGAEPALAHAWSSDLLSWKVDTVAFLPINSPSERWDRFSVWAPSVVVHGDSTFMFYTGVDAKQDQSIGYASTLDFDTCNTAWTRHDHPTWSVEQTNWTSRRRVPPGLGRQCRDPYVFRHPNPDSMGVYFLVFVAVDSAHADPFSQAVGVARNRIPGSLTSWIDLGYYRSTDATRTGFGQLEGPILIPDKGSPTGWLLMFSNAGPPSGNVTARFVRQTAGAAPWDTTLISASSSWSTPPSTLYKYLGDEPTVFGWEGTEYLRVSKDVEYLAGFTAFGIAGGAAVQGIAISRLNWNAEGDGRTFSLGAGSVTAVDAVGSSTAGVRMSFLEFRPRAHRVSWRLTLPTRMPVRLEIYDVMGRSRRRLVDGVLPGGTSIVTWDTDDDDGAVVSSGMYYARLSFEGGVRLTTMPIIR